MNRRSFIRSSVLASGVIPLLGHNYFIDKFEKKNEIVTITMVITQRNFWEK